MKLNLINTTHEAWSKVKDKVSKKLFNHVRANTWRRINYRIWAQTFQHKSLGGRSDIMRMVLMPDLLSGDDKKSWDHVLKQFDQLEKALREEIEAKPS